MNRRYIHFVCFVAVLMAGGGGVSWSGRAFAQAGQDDFQDRIIRTVGNPATSVKVTRDAWDYVIGKSAVGGGEVKVPVGQVKDVEYGSAPGGLRKAIQRAKRGVFTKAIADLDALEAKSGQMKQYVLYWLGYCYLYRGQPGDYDKSRKYFDRLLREVPETRFIYKAMLYRADTYYYERNWSKAKSAYGEAKAKFESLGRKAERSVQKFCYKSAFDAEYWSVRVLEAQQEYEKAKSLYGRIEVRTDDPEIKIKAQAGVGRCLLLLKRYTDAKRHFSRMIEAATKAGDSEVLGQAYCGLGDCYYEEKDFYNARWNYLRVVVRYYKERDYVAKAHYFAGRCYENLAKAKKERNGYARAKRHYEILVKDYPESHWATQAKEKLKKLGS